MKKFILTVLCVATFFLGLGGLIENVGASFKSDERALEIVRQARQAIGGDANINGVQSLSVKGKVTKTLNFGDETRVETGDWELNLQSPNKISKMIKIGAGVGGDGELLEKKVNVVVIKKGDGANGVIDENGSSEKVAIIKKGDQPMSNADGGSPQIRRKTITEDVSGSPENAGGDELFRTMLFLLLTAPPNSDADYIYAGDGTVDGAACEIVQINSGGESIKIYFNKSTHFPAMASYTGAKPMVFRIKKDEASAGGKQNVMVFNAQKGAAQTGEFQIKFSDYRNVSGGVQMPFKWAQTLDGAADETVDVTSYEVNPANIADKFKNEPQKIMIRTKKPE